MKEEFRDVKGYEGAYKVSNLGRIKSLERKVKHKHSFKSVREKMLKPCLDAYGYYHVNLHKSGRMKTIKIHKLVAIAFLNHVPDKQKLVINHIDFNRLNNNITNLEIVTTRQNTNRKHIKSTSEYVGVCWDKSYNKWLAQIRFNGKLKYLGRFVVEYNAHLAYQKALKEITN